MADDFTRILGDEFKRFIEELPYEEGIPYVTFISSAWLDTVLHLTPSPIKSHGEN